MAKKSTTTDESQPLADLENAERAIDPPLPETDAASRLRAFEDEHLGPDCVRINDQVERGIGSAYHRMVQKNPARQAQYEALERLIVSEQKLATAHAALIQADVDHDEAMAAAERAENDANAASAA